MGPEDKLIAVLILGMIVLFWLDIVMKMQSHPTTNRVRDSIATIAALVLPLIIFLLSFNKLVW